MDRAQRERQAYDEDALWERSHRAHMRFRHVFECPNTRRADRRYHDLLRDALAGRRALELGCGDGRLCRAALALGARYVLGADVSETQLAQARPHAVPGQLEFVAQDVSQPVAGRFDVIFGNAVLHHLDYRPVLERLYEETLSPGGIMLFREPLGANVFVRLWWRVGADAHSPDERPFYPDDIQWLRRRFPGFRLYGVNYLSLPAALMSSLVWPSPDNLALRWCDRADDWLDAHCPWLTPRFRHSIMIIAKPAPADS